MNRSKVTSDNITEIADNQVFVFGSNAAGRHGKGAAKFAMNFGAKYGQGRGLMGRTYGLLTKDASIRTLPLPKIEREIELMLECAKEHPELEFLVTAIGTGLCGYSYRQIGELFNGKDIPDNVSLPRQFWKYIK